LKAQERGAALLVVIVALAALMPLALLLSDFAWRRQRQVNGRQQNLAGQAATRGALDLTMARLQSGRLDLTGPDQSTRFELEEPEGRPVRVRLSRQDDAVLSLEGHVLTPEEAAMVDVDQVGTDGFGNVVHEYRRLEVYLVEAESPARPPFGAVRLLATVVRLDTGDIKCIGLRYDRGYFREP
jgi:type II secretory pathway pseudopilin PulG